MTIDRRTLVCVIASAALIASTAAQAQECKPRLPDSALVKPGTLVMSTNPTLPPLPAPIYGPGYGVRGAISQVPGIGI